MSKLVNNHLLQSLSVQKAAVCNGKPTIIDFYADWCESCRAMAPSMRSMEAQYKDRINFISIDGSNSKNGEFQATGVVLFSTSTSHARS
jgi:thiol-disulfide isomerase/thioredoxin